MQRLKIRKIFIFLVTFFIIAMIYKLNDKERTSKIPPRYLHRHNKIYPKNNTSSKKDKWIIVTSVNEPTEQIKKLASIKEFQLLVVGDNKTNQNWAYENTIFLSIAEQEALGFGIYPDIPFSSYTRKNIGNSQ